MGNTNNADTSETTEGTEKKERAIQQTSGEGLAIYLGALKAHMKSAGVADPDVLLRRAQKDIRKNKDVRVLPKVQLMIAEAVSSFDTEDDA